MMTLVQHLRPLAPKSLATTSDWAGVEQVSSEFSRVSILHGCPPTVTWHKNVCSRRFSDFQTHRCGAMIAIKAVPLYLDVGASFYSSLSIKHYLGWSRGNPVCKSLRYAIKSTKKIWNFGVVQKLGISYISNLINFWRFFPVKTMNYQVLTVLGYTEVTSGRVW